jgi:redox-sensitive bicupin YhaK (pirin superfamily)
MFINLSAEHERVAPRSFHLDAEQVPEAHHAGARLRVLAGEAFGVRSPLDELLTPVTLLDLTMPPGATLHLPVPLAHHAWALVIGGGGPGLAVHDAVGFGDGDTIELVAGDAGLHVVVGHGTPIGKPVLWDRSLSMSTAERLADARRRHDAGEMGRLDPSF